MKIKPLLFLCLMFLCIVALYTAYASNNVTKQKDDGMIHLNNISTNPIENNALGSKANTTTNVKEEQSNSDVKEKPSPAPTTLTKEDLSQLKANTIIDVSTLDSIKSAFYAIPIPDSVKDRILGVSYVENDDISYEDLRYVRLLHTDIEGNTRIGELIVNASIADDIVDIFYKLYEHRYPIEKVVLIDNYDGDDVKSMEDNNTSAFNYRAIAGSSTMSKHSLGQALDINPLYNPYIKTKDEVTTILPPSGDKYVDRSLENKYFIKEDDFIVELFKSYGFIWGGNWKSLKDYQHFEK